MNIQVEAVGPSRKQITIEVPAAEVDKSFGEVLASYQRFARMPGFRPGKAPVEMIKKRYAKDISKELKDYLIPRGYQAAIQEQRINSLRVVNVTDAEPSEGKPFAFSVTVDTYPDFELPDYKKIRVEAKPVQVADESVDEVVNQMRERTATFEDASGRAAEKTDRVMVNYTGSIDGVPMDGVIKDHTILAKAENFGVILDPNYAFIPEFAEALIGIKEGEKRTVEVNFDKEFIVKELAAKKAVYAVEALKVQIKRLPDITPEFLKTIGADSVEAMRERIRTDLGRMKGDQERRRMQDELFKQLLEQTAMALPESEVQEQTAQEVYDLVQYNTSRGMDRDVIEKNREEIFKAASKSAEDRIKIRFIMLKIAKLEKLEAGDAEVENHIRYLSQRARKDYAKFRADLEKNGRLKDVREDVSASKAADFLMKLQAPASIEVAAT